LKDLPKSLDETYCHTLLGIDEEKREYAQRLFRCLTVAFRPLHAEELADLFAVGFDTDAPTTFHTNWRVPDAEEAVLSACSSLININNVAGSRIVQFSHSSVKEFLTSTHLSNMEESLSYYHIIPESAHTVLAHACLCVLLQLDSDIDKKNIGRFPLALYAARYWFDHMQLGHTSQYIQDMVKSLFDPEKSHFAAWVWLYDIDRDRDWMEPMSEMYPTRPAARPLYYATMCGFYSLTEYLLSTPSQDVNRRGGSYATPLHAALVKGHFEIVSLLLRHGADPNGCDEEGLTPLHRVSQGGHPVIAQSLLKIARLLLGSGADMDVYDRQGWTPLHTAAKNGHYEMVKLLLEFRPDAQNRTRKMPLSLASGNRKPEVSLDHRADLDFRDREGWTPLHLASRYGHPDIVQLLLYHGTDVDVVRSADDRTPLHLASLFGRRAVAQVLLDRSAKVDAHQADGWTPLHLASTNGHLDVVMLLIQYGATVDYRNNKEETPLDRASLAGHLDIARFLIGCRAMVGLGVLELDIDKGEENDDCGESFFEGLRDSDTSSIITASRGQLTVVGNADTRLTKETSFRNCHILTVANIQYFKVSPCRFLLRYLNIPPTQAIRTLKTNSTQCSYGGGDEYDADPRGRRTAKGERGRARKGDKGVHERP